MNGRHVSIMKRNKRLLLSSGLLLFVGWLAYCWLAYPSSYARVQIGMTSDEYVTAMGITDNIEFPPFCTNITPETTGELRVTFGADGRVDSKTFRRYPLRDIVRHWWWKVRRQLQ